MPDRVTPEKPLYPPLDEVAIRALRDRVLFDCCSDLGWEACRDHWMRPDSVRWLLERPIIK